ncbi:unnamed protein product [Trichogramma brassicae]|uniref:Uncharacterized protein n=1 Tax=Trichogramma brassicae TaxID=86971 RepID=A0A6H5HU78_9HYME|nr:unnamed protein product [Trichogramma brassicae]
MRSWRGQPITAPSAPARSSLHPDSNQPRSIAGSQRRHQASDITGSQRLQAARKRGKIIDCLQSRGLCAVWNCFSRTRTLLSSTSRRPRIHFATIAGWPTMYKARLQTSGPVHKAFHGSNAHYSFLKSRRIGDVSDLTDD